MKYTWTGKTIGGDIKIAFNQNTNIIKLFHTIVNMFVQNTSLADVNEMVRNKVIKFAKQRAKTTHARVSAGRVKNKKIHLSTEAEAGLNYGSGDDSEDDVPVIKRLKGPLKGLSTALSYDSGPNEDSASD